jgi:hypothetical protein
MPDRIIRATILSSDAVCGLGWAEEVFYRRLLSVIDDYGRFDGRPDVLRSSCYPVQTDKVRVSDISRWLAECEMAGLLAIYEVEGRRFIQVHKTQFQIRAKKSKWPQPPANICKHVLADDSTCKHPPANAPVFVVVDVGAAAAGTITGDSPPAGAAAAAAAAEPTQGGEADERHDDVLITLAGMGITGAKATELAAMPWVSVDLIRRVKAEMRAGEGPGMLITRLEKDERAKWEAKQLAEQARAAAEAVKREEAERQREAIQQAAVENRPEDEKLLAATPVTEITRAIDRTPDPRMRSAIRSASKDGRGLPTDQKLRHCVAQEIRAGETAKAALARVRPMIIPKAHDAANEQPQAAAPILKRDHHREGVRAGLGGVGSTGPSPALALSP